MDGADRAALEPQVAADAVVDVHHEVADLQRAQILQQGARGALFLRWAMRARAEDLFLGDQHEAGGGCQHPSRERRGHDADVLGLRQLVAFFPHAHGRAAVGQESGQALGLGLGARANHDLEARVQIRANALQKRLESALFAVLGARAFHGAGEIR